MTVVADSAPLIALARIGRTALLGDVFGTVLVPSAVWDEVMRPGRAGVDELARSAWIERATITTAPMTFPSSLGAGEREAIHLAAHRQRPLLTDDRAARRFAEGLGIAVTRTLAVLIVAEERALLSDAASVVTDLEVAGLFLGPQVRRAFQEALSRSRTTREGPE